MKFKITAAMLAVLGVALTPTVALAHPKVVSANPAPNTKAARTKVVTLTFSERLTPKLSSATLVMTGMPGMANHAPMKMAGVTSKVAPNGKSLVLTSAKPLGTGTYRVDWAVVGADAHRVTGTHSFSIT